MGASLHVAGFKPANDQWDKMKSVYESCQAAGIDIPKEVAEFFDYEPPENKAGLEVDLETALQPYQSEGCDGYELKLSDIPAGVESLRIFNAY